MFVLGENHFWKCFSVFTGVWLRMENVFFGNAFQLACVQCKLISVFILPSNTHFLENTERAE